MRPLVYKGYLGRFDYEPEDDAFLGEVVGINDVVTFEGLSIDELRRSFQESVDYYLELCAKAGKRPEKALCCRGDHSPPARAGAPALGQAQRPLHQHA